MVPGDSINDKLCTKDMGDTYSFKENMYNHYYGILF